jgi:photosystem II stability/assembly factor-like uncharacterized protein
MLGGIRRAGALAVTALLTALAVSACGESSQMDPRSTRATQRSLTQRSLLPNSIAFWDARDGLIGTGVTWRKTTGTVSATSDGGKTYRVVLRTEGPVSWVSTAGSSDAWAVVGRCTTTSDCVSAELLHSRDRGSTWQELPDPGVMRVSFADPSRGLAVAGKGRLLSTSDGGKTWSSLALPCSQTDAQWAKATDELFVSLPTARRAWAVCVSEPGAGNQGKTVYRSDDGGRSWTIVANRPLFRRPKAASGGLSSYGYPAGVSFSRQGSGLLWESRGTLDLSRDGGRHWKALRVATPEVDSGLSAQMLSRELGFALLFNGDLGYRLLATADGGTEWRLVHRWLPPAQS